MKKMGMFQKIVTPVALATAVVFAAQTSSALIIATIGGYAAITEQKSYTKAGLWVVAGASVAGLFSISGAAVGLGIILFGENSSSISEKELSRQQYSPEEIALLKADLNELHARSAQQLPGQDVTNVVVCGPKETSADIKAQLKSISPTISDFTAQYYVDQFCGELADGK